MTLIQENHFPKPEKPKIINLHASYYVKTKPGTGPVTVAI